MPGSLLSQYSFSNGRSVPSCCVTRYCSGVSSDTASGFLLYVFIFRTPLQASYKYDRETPWPVLATRPTMIHEEGRTASRSCQAIMVDATG